MYGTEKDFIRLLNEKTQQVCNCFMILKLRKNNISYQDYCKLYLCELTENEFYLVASFVEK